MHCQGARMGNRDTGVVTLLESMAEYCRSGMKEVTNSYAENILRFELEDILERLEKYRKTGGGNEDETST